MIHATHPRYTGPLNAQAAQLLTTGLHYPPSDLPLFTAAYNELCRLDLNGQRVMEVCCGYGELSAAFAAAFPDAEMIAVDRYPDAGQHVREAMERLPKLRYAQGDAFRLPQFADGTFDLIFGQAALHHLAHDVPALAQEYARLLKPGGRLVFIFEPLGHNPLFAAIRAARFARMQLTDESNLVFTQFEELARWFSSGEVQVFNLLGYPMKALQGSLARTVACAVDRVDAWIFEKSPGWMRQAANCNLVFTR